jgi:glycosyltransferase involved in cell wall biosynthesis
MKKILIIAPLPPPYHGMATATQALVDSEIKKQFHLDIINTNSAELKEQWQFSLKRIRQILKFWVIFLYKLIKNRPHLVYLTIAQSSFGFLKDCPLIILSKLFGKKCVIHFHGGLFGLTYQKSKFFARWIMTISLKLVDATVVLTDSLKSMVNQVVPEEKIYVIPNCVEDSLILSPTEVEKNKNRINQNLKPFTVLYFSNLIKSKGYFDVLKATCDFKDNSIKFIFVGSWLNQEEKKEVEEFIQSNQIEKLVEFMEPVYGERKKQLLIASDVFVLPTYYPQEGLPITMLEAMACGLPVIVTQYRGIADVITEGENGFFVPARDPQAIANKIKILLQDKNLRLRIAENNIKKVKDNFTKQRYIQKFIKLFNTLLGV